MTDASPPRCDAEGRCITCGDHAVPMRVAAADVDGLVPCRADTGEEELVDTTLVAPVAPGDRVLVHAGVALARLAEVLA